MPNDEQDRENPRLVTIIINTRSYEVPKDDLLFEELAQLAYPRQSGRREHLVHDRLPQWARQ
jgi:Multiubiquitin